ncbi:Uncharacterized protein BM_BM3332 [Brugia malayi]|uniref:Bm3332, isoform g; IWS1 C-terminus family protein n=3 Tax=Brugia malayi TaxID=6279 RepID=A0A4E9EZG5_BRUMA|nr:Uncharacterized protein BM_BM3332 [Brugia malayi]VIO88467.1 Uncharacterized protein BM_BM3332 [Brugia malayi]
MTELDEGDVADNGSGSFEISQEGDGITPLNLVQSIYPVAETSSDVDDSKNVVEDDDEKDNSSSHSHFSSREFVFPVKCLTPTEGELKEEGVVNQDENLEQHSETKEKIDYDQINMGDEMEKVDTNHERVDNDSDGDEDKHDGSSKPRRIMLSSDEEDNIDAAPAAEKSRDDSESEGDEEHAEVGVGELMTNIFGEDSDDEKEGEDVQAQYQAERNGLEGDDDEPRYVRDENDEDDGRVWDFDTMMREKKAERRRPRRRRRDGSIDVGGAYDDQIKMLIDAMKSAAKDDRHSNIERRPALQKRKMLPHVKAMLIKHDLMEAIIDNGMMNVISEWLAPLPDKSLPALEIRTDLLKILQDFSRLEPGTLKQSGLGRAVMLLYKHPRETKENKALAARLISDWARPIFQLDTDFRSMTKDERIQRDYAQLSEAKRRRLDAGSESSDAEKEISEPRPGDKGFIVRARVPRPSQKDYVVRPKSNVEGQFRGATKNRSNSRFDRTQREFKERTKQQRTQRAVAVTINRVNI